MKIALICVYYPPLRSSCAIQMRDLAQELILQGHEPIVIVPTEGLLKTWQKEMLDGVIVYRLAAFKTMEIGYIRRAFNEFILPFAMIYGLRKSDFPMKTLDAIAWYSPTIFFGPLVHYLKWTSKCPSYLILRDIFPEWALDLGILNKGVAYYLFKLVANYQYFVADIIGVQTSSNLNYLKKWAQVNNRKLEVLNNWLSIASKKGTSISINKTSLKGKKNFVYIGNMGIAQGMDVLIDLANSFKEREDIGFLFVGRGSEIKRLQRKVIDYKLDNFLFYDEIDSEELPSLLSMCHVGLLALDPRHKSHNIPGKFLTYIQAGLPVLARINEGTDLVNLIESEGVGCVYVDNVIEDFKHIAENLMDNEKELKSMSERGKLLSKRMFSSASAVKQITSAIMNA